MKYLGPSHLEASFSSPCLMWRTEYLWKQGNWQKGCFKGEGIVEHKNKVERKKIGKVESLRRY